jgi:SAM-dependent methyltransferase
MARIQSPPDDPATPRIDPVAVAAFFDGRARKIDQVGPLRAVIYQDRHPDLAERRDLAEKQCLLPRLALDGQQRLLDIGCGTGRWAGELLHSVAHYHGVDISTGLVDFARHAYAAYPHCRFSVASAVGITLGRLDEREPFDRILCAGVLIYLNDDDLTACISAIGTLAAPTCRILMREPMAIEQRLTIQDHFSTDLQQIYNAIYRTEGELSRLLLTVLRPLGFSITAAGDVFLDDALNNRAETRQRWLLLERRQ